MIEERRSFKRSDLTKDTNYDFVFKNAKINLRNKEDVILDGNISCNVFFITGSNVYSRESYFTTEILIKGLGSLASHGGRNSPFVFSLLPLFLISLIFVIDFIFEIL